MEDLALYPRRSLNEVRYKRKIANHLWIFFALSCIGSFFTFVLLRRQMFQRFANRKSHDDPPRKARAARLRPYSVAGSRTISLTSRCMDCRIHLGPIWRPSLRLLPGFAPATPTSLPPGQATSRCRRRDSSTPAQMPRRKRWYLIAML